MSSGNTPSLATQMKRNMSRYGYSKKRPRIHRYSDIAYADLKDTSVQTRTQPLFNWQEKDNDILTLGHKLFIQGVDLSDYVVGQLSWQTSGVEGSGNLSFTLSNANNSLVLTPQNLIGSIRVADDDLLNNGLADAGLPAFTDYESEKEAIFNYKNDQERNPKVIRDGGGEFDARYPLFPNSPIIQKMDAVRLFIPVPFLSEDTDEKWMPAFTGYVNNVHLEDDWVTGHSNVRVECACIRTMVLRKMRVSFDLSLGKMTAADTKGGAFRNKTSLRSSLFQDLIIGNKYAAASVNLPLHKSVSQYLVDRYSRPVYMKMSKRSVNRLRLKNRPKNKGVLGIKDAGDYYYSPDKDASEDISEKNENFLEDWHRLTLFGAKRRPWTEEEVNLVGEGTTSEGEFSPNNINLWKLVPEAGSGPGNLADKTALHQSVAHDVNWNNRDDIIKQLIDSVDYQIFISGVGDIFLEFSMGDFNPRDFGEFKGIFSFNKDLQKSNVADDNGDVPSGVLVQTGYGNAASAAGPVDTNYHTKAFVYSPAIANRLGITIKPLHLPFIPYYKKGTASQMAAIELQKSIANASVSGLDFTYRPLLTPNRPINNERRTRIGKIVSVTNNITLTDRASANTTVQLNEVRKWSGKILPNGELEYQTLTGGRATPLSPKHGWVSGHEASSGIEFYPKLGKKGA